MTLSEEELRAYIRSQLLEKKKDKDEKAKSHAAPSTVDDPYPGPPLDAGDGGVGESKETPADKVLPDRDEKEDKKMLKGVFKSAMRQGDDRELDAKIKSKDLLNKLSKEDVMPTLGAILSVTSEAKESGKPDEKLVKKLKKDPDVDNPWALAKWIEKNKQ